METYRKFILIGIIIIALGITLSNTLKDEVDSLGNVMIAVGGLFLIIGMSKKQKEDKNNP